MNIKPCPSVWLRTAATILPLLCLLQIGCAGSGSGIVIHDFATAKTVGEIPMGYFREIIREEVRPKGAFFTMTMENSLLAIRRRDASGREESKQSIPMLNTVWHEPNWCALDDSGARLAYFDDETKVLKVMKLGSEVATKLPSPKIKSAVYIKLFRWTGPNSLIILTTRPDEDSSMEISRITVGTGAIETIPTDLDWYPQPILSPDAKWLAGVTEDESKIVIMDSTTLARKATIERPSSDTSFDGILWAEDSKSLYFTHSTLKDEGRHIVRYNLIGGTREDLPPPPTPASRGLLLCGSLGDTITATIGTNTWLLDVKRREWTKIGHSNGTIFGIRGTTRYAVTQ